MTLEEQCVEWPSEEEVGNAAKAYSDRLEKEGFCPLEHYWKGYSGFKEGACWLRANVKMRSVEDVRAETADELTMLRRRNLNYLEAAELSLYHLPTDKTSTGVKMHIAELMFEEREMRFTQKLKNAERYINELEAKAQVLEARIKELEAEKREKF